MMIALTFLFAAEAVPHSMLAAADNANAAYVQCLFATARAANGVQLSIEAFESRLDRSCRTEEQELLRTGTAVLSWRGEANAAARVRQLADEARHSVIETYRQTSRLKQ
jgi:hypothetical protein